MTSLAKDTWYREVPARRPVMRQRASAAPQTALVVRQLLQAGAVGSIVVIGLMANDWVASLALIFLYAGWKLLKENGPPVVAASFTAQWIQVNGALIYFALTGRAVYQ